MHIVKKVVKKVEATISRYRMIKPGDRLVAAVSGGADSVCLLDVLHHMKKGLGLTLIVAHFNHGLRPDADEDETRFVRDLAASLDLDVVVSKADPPLDPRGPSLEEKARGLRYRFLREVREGCAAQKIATGHTLNDQAETVLMRLLRGSGPPGLSGIQPVRKGGIIRPLIEVTREDILTYLDNRKLQHITDPSNVETRHLRNDIRLHLIPRLETYQPRIIEILGRTADITREENRWLTAEARAWIGEWGQTGPGNETILPVTRFRELPEALKNHVVREALKMAAGSLRRISLAHIDAIKRLAVSGKPQVRVMLPHRLLIRRAYERLIFSKEVRGPADEYCCFIERTGTFHMDAPGCTLILEEMETEALSGLDDGPWSVCLDADQIIFPLLLRNFRPGDRFIPLGMKGHKKVKDFFVDMKIPSDIRSRIPVLTQGDQLIWVCGLRMDDRFKVTPRTRRVLKVAFGGAGPVLPDDLRARKEEGGAPTQGSDSDT
jgi:tRNA(Ile)-lysidine synthase